jgi:hypothetical protein
VFAVTMSFERTFSKFFHRSVYCWSRWSCNDGKSTSKLATTLCVGSHPHAGFHNKTALRYTALHTHEQKHCTS